MFKRKARLCVLCGLLVVAVVLLGCSSQKALWGNEKNGFVLTYRMMPGESVSYSSNGTEKTSLKIMGSDYGSTTNFVNSFTLAAKESGNENVNTTVTINELVLDSQSPQGNNSIDTSPVLGKNFELIFSPLGRELEYIGIEDLKIDMGPQSGGVQDVLNYYRSLLPDLPDRPMKIGESWVAEEEFSGPAGNLDVTVKSKNTHTLQGMENVDGLECLKISTAVHSDITGTGVQDGNDLDFIGTAEATGTWYFAYKKGMFVKSESTSEMEGNIDVSGSVEFSIPITQTTTSTVGMVN